MSKISRGQFLANSAAGLAGLSIIPSKAMGKAFGHIAPSDKVNVAGIGIGGRGSSVLRDLGDNANIMALADVDWKYAKSTMDRYPNAKKYYDYREMFDKQSKDIDAVMVATADHTHCIIASEAMTMGKHVYCEKPLTHSVYESRLLTNLAASTGVATQMGNQGASGEGTNQIIEWIQNGEIGEVTRVDCATDRPIWPQGLNSPKEEMKIPSTLKWDLFTGPAKLNPYNAIYHPWNWRGWWDYGTGALGDMACHILHNVFMSLNLKYPTKVEGSSTLLLNACAPQAQHVKLTYPARENMPKVAMPEVEIHWYDGGLLPDRPKGYPEGMPVMQSGGGVTIYHGTKDTLICSCYGYEPWLLSGRKPNVAKTVRRVEGTHGEDFIRACKESTANRVLTKSDFSSAGPFNEMVVMGVLAVRLQGLNKELLWDGENMQFTNIKPDETIKTVIEDGFEIHDGHPTFNKTYTDPINAQEFANELIKHNYRQGWNLIDMPK